jgi:ATP-binding cassette subfamily F protein 3
MESLRDAEKKTVVVESKSSAKKEAYQLSKEQEKELKKLNNRLSKIETEIADLEAEIEKIDLELAQNYDEVSAKPDFFKNYKAKKAKIDVLMEEWEIVEGKVASF